MGLMELIFARRRRIDEGKFKNGGFSIFFPGEPFKP
jgi:hypothetical protein